MNQDLMDSMLQEFDGCEGSDPGSPQAPSIWLFGIEPGYSLKDQARVANGDSIADEDYSVDRQLTWPFNRNAFKLFAAMEGRPVTEYREFARARQPFVKGSKGYFKGNLFPYACRNTREWTEEVARETGLADKSAYQQWCRENRWPVIRQWVEKYRPKVFIGVGVGKDFRQDFASAVFGRTDVLEPLSFRAHGRELNLYHYAESGKRLVVIPHLSRGLTSHEGLQNAGGIIADMLST